MTTVLLTIDESDAAHLAALTATTLFGEDADYLAVHAEPAPVGTTSVWGAVHGYGYPMVAPEQLTDPVSRRRAIAEARLIAAEQTGIIGIDAEPIGEVGDPADAIRRAAEDHQVDVVVVGEHRRSWLRRLIDDSVAETLLQSAGVPVLAVPIPDDVAEAMGDDST